MHAEWDSPHAIYSTVCWAIAKIWIGLSIPIKLPWPSLPPSPLPQLYTLPFVVSARQWLDPLAIALIITFVPFSEFFPLCSLFSGGKCTSYGVLTAMSILLAAWPIPRPRDPLLPIPHDQTSCCLVNNKQYEWPQQILTGSPISFFH